jgi:hypothetical protein
MVMWITGGDLEAAKERDWTAFWARVDSLELNIDPDSIKADIEAGRA